MSPAEQHLRDAMYALMAATGALQTDGLDSMAAAIIPAWDIVSDLRMSLRTASQVSEVAA